MSAGQVDDMDVIAYAGTVNGIVIVSIHFYTIMLANCHLGDERQ
jgi:hypothetical protein